MRHLDRHNSRDVTVTPPPSNTPVLLPQPGPPHRVPVAARGQADVRAVRHQHRRAPGGGQQRDGQCVPAAERHRGNGH